jgi:hypothetical protein
MAAASAANSPGRRPLRAPRPQNDQHGPLDALNSTCMCRRGYFGPFGRVWVGNGTWDFGSNSPARQSTRFTLSRLPRRCFSPRRYPFPAYSRHLAATGPTSPPSTSQPPQFFGWAVAPRQKLEFLMKGGKLLSKNMFYVMIVYYDKVH